MHAITRRVAATAVLMFCASIALAQPCVPAPRGTSFWAPLDENAGAALNNIAKPTYSGFDVGGPQVVSGYVSPGLARRYDGYGQYSEFPDHPWLNPIEGTVGETLSIECWVNVPSGGDVSGIRVIVDKRQMVGGSLRGFALFTDGGYLGCQIADGAYSNYVAYVPSHRILPDDQWRFVAVTMHRTLGVGTLYLDMVPWSFDPSAHQGVAANGAPLRIGASALGAPTSFFSGTIDEVTLSQKWLPAADLQAVYAAAPFGVAGQCKSECVILAPNGFTSTQSCAWIPARIYNHNVWPVTYTWSFQAVPAFGAPGCTINGPTQILPPAGTMTVPALSSADVGVLINRPLGVGYACLSMTASDGNHSLGAYGTFYVEDIGLQVGPDCSAYQLARGPVQAGASRVGIATFDLANATPSVLPVSYQVAVLAPDGSPDATSVSLNGLPPGSLIAQALLLPPAGTANVQVTATFVRTDPLRDYAIVLYELSTGVPRLLSSLALRDERPAGVSSELLAPEPGSLDLEVQGASPGSPVISFFTIAPGAFPFGWFLGLDLSLGDLAAQAAFAQAGAPPFLLAIAADGRAHWSITGIPAGIPVQGVSLVLGPLGTPVDVGTPFALTTR